MNENSSSLKGKSNISDNLQDEETSYAAVLRGSQNKEMTGR